MYHQRSAKTTLVSLPPLSLVPLLPVMPTSLPTMARLKVVLDLLVLLPPAERLPQLPRRVQLFL